MLEIGFTLNRTCIWLISMEDENHELQNCLWCSMQEAMKQSEQCCI